MRVNDCEVFTGRSPLHSESARRYRAPCSIRRPSPSVWVEGYGPFMSSAVYGETERGGKSAAIRDCQAVRSGDNLKFRVELEEHWERRRY